MPDLADIGGSYTHYLAASASTGIENQLASRSLQNLGKKIQQRFVGATVDWRSVDRDLHSPSMHTKQAGDFRAGSYVKQQHRIGAYLARPRMRANQRARIRRLSRRSRLALAPAFE